MSTYVVKRGDQYLIGATECACCQGRVLAFLPVRAAAFIYADAEYPRAIVDRTPGTRVVRLVKKAKESDPSPAEGKLIKATPLKVKCPTCRCHIMPGSVCACCAGNVGFDEESEVDGG